MSSPKGRPSPSSRPEREAEFGSCTLSDGVRLATLTAGMAFGEMALLKPMRPADAPADASILADRLIVANTKVNLLTAS